MQLLHTSALVVHVISGFSGLLIGTFLMILRKGGKVHRRLGRWFFICLLGVSCSAIILALINPNRFLLLIGGFTLYQGLSGFRAARVRLERFGLVDALITLIGAVSAVPMLLSGQVILLVFGAICAFLVVRDVSVFLLFIRHRPVPRLLWLGRHIGLMLGSYIAMLTAFLVVNVRGEGPGALVLWFAPTVVLVPLMLYWIRRYTLPKLGAKPLLPVG
jgi:uncharacterized membrane protein